MHASECLNIMVAIGSKFPCHGKCPNMWLTMQGYRLHTNIYALLLGACDIMFGSQWLLTLCPILWDFNELKMQFSCYGKGFTLKERKMEQNRLWMLIKLQRLIHKGTPCAITSIFLRQHQPHQRCYQSCWRLRHYLRSHLVAVEW